MKSKFLAGAAGCRFEVRTPFRRTARKAAATVAAGSLLLAGAGVVHADLITNSLPNTVGSVAKVMPLNAGGATGTTKLGVVATNDDGKNGCNFQASESLTLDFVSSNPAVATVTPNVTLTSCSSDQPSITVTPGSAGEAIITAREVRNDTGDAFDLRPATFTVRVAAPAPANTAPTMTISGTEWGGTYPKGYVPPTVCNADDAEDGEKSPAPALSPITGDYAADGIGSQTATCSYKDAGGLTVTSAVTYSIVDTSQPVITYTVNPADPDGLNGWYKSPVTLTWDVSEPESPLSMTRTGCENVTVSSDQLEQSYTCSAVSAGGSTGPVTASLKKDALAPTVTYGGPTAGTLGTNGWYTSPVTVSFTGMDATSGPASATATASSVGEGDAVKIGNPEFKDLAGNATAAGTVLSDPFKIDTTKPTDISFSSDLSTSFYGYTPTAPTCTATDNVSGVESCIISGYRTEVGTHTLTATAKDYAGNTNTATQLYTVSPWRISGFYQPVDMGGVLNTVKGGSTVPVKFEVFAGDTEITDANKVSFKMGKMACSATAATAELETLASGSTSLRYDAVAGQFVYNWKTPTGAGTCYTLTMTSADGSTTSAFFKMR